MIIFLFLFQIIFARRNDSVIFILCRNEDLHGITESIRSFEKVFNSKHNYPYVFMNDKPWEQEFMQEIGKIVSSDAYFDIIDPKDWDMPDSINLKLATANWEDMAKHGVPYANMLSYHNMCRFFSRSFYNQPIVMKYKYYWRIEPGVKFYCEIDFDPFEQMEVNQWKYGFNIAIYEFIDSIRTLGTVTNDFFDSNKHMIAKDRMEFMHHGKKYNGCHFWSNFEIGSFEFLRSPEYQAYVDHLEKSGGFYYERWGDAPVHSLAASFLLNRDEVHFFEEIGYTHAPFTHCPKNGNNCSCDASGSIDYKTGSCLGLYQEDQKKKSVVL